MNESKTVQFTKLITRYYTYWIFFNNYLIIKIKKTIFATNQPNLIWKADLKSPEFVPFGTTLSNYRLQSEIHAVCSAHLFKKKCGCLSADYGQHSNKGDYSSKMRWLSSLILFVLQESPCPATRQVTPECRTPSWSPSTQTRGESGGAAPATTCRHLTPGCMRTRARSTRPTSFIMKRTGWNSNISMKNLLILRKKRGKTN